MQRRFVHPGRQHVPDPTSIPLRFWFRMWSNFRAMPVSGLSQAVRLMATKAAARSEISYKGSLINYKEICSDRQYIAKITKISVKKCNFARCSGGKLECIVFKYYLGGFFLFDLGTTGASFRSGTFPLSSSSNLGAESRLSHCGGRWLIHRMLLIFTGG